MADAEPPADMNPEPKNYLGLDFSTQQVKGIVINDRLEVTHEAAVQFDNDLPEYRTHGGVQVRDDGGIVTSPTIMWVKALDMLMDKLRVAGADFSTIAAVSGSAQQHGSVYWRGGANKTLGELQGDRFLHDQLALVFSLTDSPVWMDSSTTHQCRHLEEALGGPQKLAELTGSRAYERFTGSQIAKVYQNRKEAYNNTERISLVSSFACSLFLGKYAPIDLSDGSGMNLLDITTKTWSQQCLDACGGSLGEKLGDPVVSWKVVGSVSSYMVDRYTFSPDTAIVAFTGDNPASLAGLCVESGDLAVSLGTSDTLFLWLDTPRPRIEGHIFVSPIQEGAYMGLLCYKNGSLTRERIRDSCCEGSWDIFSQLLDMTPRGNFGNIGMYYHLPEITPGVEGLYRFNKTDEAVGRFASNEVEVRALIEGQFLAKRVHAERLGFATGIGGKVLATGGASNNKAILQVLADVFNATVYTLDVANSACLGSAYRAKHGLAGGRYQDIIKNQLLKLACKPNSDANEIYTPMVMRFQAFESSIVEQQKKK
ncbi:hypothetical protein Pmani_032982 [Petrolisthes manimaculis]|uniref:Xylulose kinase n=1 Tax=Petrolisthes manimaculis TaxID=1843537 RepID=A0AAE1NSI9_9EUCA|nr:hypothetical protein Pmani_032982 [Petrolisthes manimaculis]